MHGQGLRGLGRIPGISTMPDLGSMMAGAQGAFAETLLGGHGMPGMGGMGGMPGMDGGCPQQ